MSTKKRLSICYLVSALNLSTVLVSAVTEWSIPFRYVAIAMIANIIVAWALLQKVEPSAGVSDHLRLISYSKRWMLGLGSVAAIATLLGSYARVLENWATLPVCAGFLFFLVGARILSISLEARMGQASGN